MKANAPSRNDIMKAFYLLACIVLCASVLPAQYSVSNLSQLGDYQSARSSSFDRTGGNHDYVSLRPGETIEIFNEDGPGEVRHIWTTLPPWSEAYHLKKIVLRMYWDNEPSPSV